jgi:hypothetical protein
MATLVGAAMAVLLVAGPGTDPKLVGTWTSGGQTFMVLNADGTGQMEEGPVRWSAAGGILSVTASDGSAERVPYQVEGDTLTMALSAGQAQLTRARATPAAPENGAAPTPPRAGGAKPSKAAAAPGTAASSRAIRFNGRALEPAELRTLEQLERFIGRIPDGDYWYDPRTGASGRWGGPALAFLPAGLELGGAVPADASGGGKGTLTGVFMNGREVHPVDVAGFQSLVGAVLPGRWWVDAQGNYGLEGGPPMGNLVAMAQARRRAGQGGGNAWSKRYEGTTPGQNMNLASDGTTTCVSVSGYSRCTGE